MSKTSELEFYCPQCQKYFETPSAWVSPCCGAQTNGGDDYNCPECGEKFEADEEIPKCPHCGNIGGRLWTQPDYAECFKNKKVNDNEQD